jgi:outer membrane scaffolding protein for murein synthesis (MipA/OmpV family)
VFGSATYSRLQGDFAASPVTRIAGTPDQLIGAAGISYTF